MEGFVTRVLHTLNLTEYDKARALIEAWTNMKSGHERIKVISLIVQYCE